MGLISISFGLWEDFQQLWLENYGFAVESIANILGWANIISAIICVIAIWRTKVHQLKYFTGAVILAQIIALMVLFISHNAPEMAPIVRVFATIDAVCQQLAFISIWPLMAAYRKDEDTYGAIRLAEYVFRDLGVLMGGLFIGRTIGNFVVGYNTFLGMALTGTILAFITLTAIDSIKPTSTKSDSFSAIIKQIVHDKMLLLYFGYHFIGRIALTMALGLKMLIFTNILSFTAGAAVNYLLALSILADIIGVVCLRWLTPRNDYFTVSLKFGGRVLMYLAAFLTNSPFVILAAMTFAIILSKAFDNRTEAPYMIRIKCQGQFCINGLRRAVRTVATAIGMAAVGAIYSFGFRYVMVVAAVFTLIQTVIAYALIYLREHERHTKKIANKYIK